MSLTAKFKDEFNKSPGRYAAGFILLFLLACLCVYQISGYITFLWPGEEAFNQARRELANSQAALLKAMNERYELKRHRESLKGRANEYWLKSRDGDPAVDIKKIVDKAAEASGFPLSSIGATRSTKVTDGVSLVGMSVRGKTSFKTIVEFIAELEKETPTVYWKSLLLRPTSARRPDEIILNGYIQVLAVSDPELVRLITGTEEK
jgi:hypothetical protein